MSTFDIEYTNVEEAAETVFEILRDSIGVNTFFIAKNDGYTVDVLKAFNRNKLLLEEGFQTEFNQSYWIHIIRSGREPLIIPNLNENDLTKDMEVTKGWGGGSLIGIPIISKTGKKFGTLCGMDDVPFVFQEKDVSLFKRMATLLTYILEVDNAYQEVLKLSTPVVLVSARVGVLPIIGDINAKRSEQMMDTILMESKRLALEHLVIDLSGITDIEHNAASYLLSLLKTLKLIGVEVVFTGMRPDLAQKVVSLQTEFKQAAFYANLRSGISSIDRKVLN